jgi:hypothetical protein
MRALGRNGLQEWLLLLGFVAIVVTGVLTVALPELSKEPEAEPNTARDSGTHDSTAHAK